jgi:sulfite exporter TauE/SafE
MDGFSWVIIGSAAGLALLHTVLGPDHTLPFVMLARARRWSITKTLSITFACGLGHVASSFVLGGIGLALGYGVSQLEGAESLRGDLAAWALIIFGFAYALWGLRIAIRKKAGIVPHSHHGHVHIHSHGEHDHQHRSEDRSGTTFWALFIVFVLGPCEPLIVFFMEPASRGNWSLALTAGLVFAVVTLATMLTLVGVALAGFQRLRLGGLERWSHALAGGIIATSGLAVVFLGL